MTLTGKRIVDRMRKWLTRLLENFSTKRDKLEPDGNQVAESAASHMSPLEHYLSYYIEREEPGYAVLVTGEWGIGKTYQVNRAIPAEQRYYVSLFGLQSTEAIFAAVFAAMFPWESQLKTDTITHKSATVFGLPIGAVASQLANVLIRDKVNTDRTIVFDDLERCSVASTDLLGVINRYVEHHKCRVVVIAHEGKLHGELLEQREKVFGQVIKVIPEIEAAYDAFSAELGNTADDAPLTRFRGDIIGLFKESNAGSLRILRHVLEDSIRLYGCISTEQQQQTEAVRELVRLVSAFNIEVRAGRMGPADLQNRSDKFLMFELERRRERGDEVQEPPFVAAQKRYATINMDSALVSDDILHQLLFDGVYDSQKIESILSSSVQFAEPEETRSWKLFMEFHHQPDDIANAAMQRMENEFDRREFVEPGEILHVFALRLMMSKNGLTGKSIDEIVIECQSYLRDLVSSNNLKPLPRSWNDREDLGFGYMGYAYWIEDSYRDIFGELFNRLREYRHTAMIDGLDDAGPAVLALVESDGEKLYAQLNHTADGDAEYADVPVLSKIAPEDFVASWMRSHPKNWNLIKKSIEERINLGGQEKLADELPWVMRVNALLEAEAQRERGVRAVRIRRCIPKSDRLEAD